MVTSTGSSKASDLERQDISLGNVTLDIPASVPIHHGGEEIPSSAPIHHGGEEGEDRVEVDNSTMRTSPEGSPSHSPGGTPPSTKRVQFRESDVSAAAVNMRTSGAGSDVVLPADDDKGARDMASDDDEPQMISEISGERVHFYDGDDEHDEPPPTAEDAHKARDHVHFADDVPENSSESAPDDIDHFMTNSEVYKENTNIIKPTIEPILHKQQNGGGLVSVEPGGEPRDRGSDRVVTRWQWMCCCGLGWFMVGVVALTAGILLLLYLREHWLQHTRESVLVYFGVGACIAGGLTSLVGLGFWTYACIIWTPSKQHKDPEKQAHDHDPGWHKKTKYVVNTEMRRIGHVTAMPHDHVTSDITPDAAECDSRMATADPVRDDTFMI